MRVIYSRKLIIKRNDITHKNIAQKHLCCFTKKVLGSQPCWYQKCLSIPSGWRKLSGLPEELVDRWGKNNKKYNKRDLW